MYVPTHSKWIYPSRYLWEVLCPSLQRVETFLPPIRFRWKWSVGQTWAGRSIQRPGLVDILLNFNLSCLILFHFIALFVCLPISWCSCLQYSTIWVNGQFIFILLYFTLFVVLLVIFSSHPWQFSIHFSIE